MSRIIFTFLREVMFPHLARRAQRGAPRRVRIGSAGCSMDDEPYSLAMEALDFPGFAENWDIRILASGISTRVLEIARGGIYPWERVAPLGEKRQRRVLRRGKGASQGLWQIRPEVQRLISFRHINFNDHVWPINTQFDVLFCRNVIIYFDVPTQQTVLGRLVKCVTDDGYLMLGHSESPHCLSEYMSPLRQTTYRQSRTGAKPASTSKP